MKVLLIIDHFGSGGAQRQIVELACGLKRHGHDVEMFVYFPQYDFFRSRIEQQQIKINEYAKEGRFSFGLVRRLASLMRKGEFDIAVSYLKSTNSYAELAKLGSGRTKLVVSERTSHHDDKSWLAAVMRRLLHGFADHVVANSKTHSEWLQGKSWLRHKVSYIYNGLDLDVFSPALSGPIVPESPQSVWLLGIGRIGPEKNILNLILGMQAHYDEFGYCPHLSWVGRRDESRAGQQYCENIDCLLEKLPEVERHWHWLGLQSEITELLQRHHALIHPSLYEGLPNVVCEGLASGLPVLVSDVCDHSLLVADGERGFLFDPENPDSISKAISKLLNLSKESWLGMSRGAREFAISELGVEKMVLAYENLFVKLVGER